MFTEKRAGWSADQDGRRTALVLAALAPPFLIGQNVVRAYWAYPAAGGDQLRLGQLNGVGRIHARRGSAGGPIATSADLVVIAAKIGPPELSDAIERVFAGLECPSGAPTAEDRGRIVFHQSGRAVCAAVLSDDPAAKGPIIGGGHRSGFTWYMHEGDPVHATRSLRRNRLVARLGGHAAGELGARPVVDRFGGQPGGSDCAGAQGGRAVHRVHGRRRDVGAGGACAHPGPLVTAFAATES